MKPSSSSPSSRRVVAMPSAFEDVGSERVDVTAGEDVGDLPDADDRQTRLADPCQVVRARGLEREVVPVRGAPVGAGLALEGPGDDAPDRVLAHQLPARDAARLVQLLERNGLLVRGDLEDRVGGGVDDPLAGALVLLAEPLDDLGARCGDVADDPAPRRLAERVDHVVRKAIRVRGHRLLGDHAHQLPVAGGGVLAGRVLAQATCDGRRVIARRAPHEREHVAEPERLHVRKVEPADGVRDVLQRARPGIAVRIGVGQRTRTNGIEHDQASAAAHRRNATSRRGKAGDGRRPSPRAGGITSAL